MAIQKPSIPKGTRDFGPKEVQKRKHILNVIETVFKKYGFMPIETPTMENLSTLEGKYGEEGDKLLFRIVNSGDAFKDIKEKNGETQIADFTFRTSHISEKGLRYDLTVPFARYVVMNKEKIVFPFKRYQMQPVWRADRPQKGRYREFWQCDADVVGSDSLLNEIDLVNIYHEAFHDLGIPYELKTNNRKILAGIAETVKGIEHINTIAVAIDKLDKIGTDGVRNELAENGFSDDEITRLFDIISIKGDQQLNLLKSKLHSSQEGLKGIEELHYVLSQINLFNPAINISIDFSLARGLSYYTGCIFEVVATAGSLQSSIGGGGRYDNLTGIFGMPNVSGVGISFGLDRIYDVMEELNLFPAELNATATQILICAFNEENQQKGLGLLKQLRDAGIASELYPDLPKSNKEKDKPMVKPMNYADALGIPFTLLMNESGLVLKDMKAKTETGITIEEVIRKLH